MKSAWELALERTGGQLNELSDDLKEKMQDIESLYKSKLVAAEMAAQERAAKCAGNIEELKQIQEDLIVEKASLNSKMEQEKEKIRKG
ncbi:MAG: hypothetical protein JXR78_14665 [Victivallales bacterium]|jgi:hypothetical protein|nr:hypothetical protein [Victivallales bacterium]